MAKLGNLTSKVAGAVVSGTKSVSKSAVSGAMSFGRGTAKVASGVVGGITKGISRTTSSLAKSAARTTSQTFELDALKPTNLLHSALDSVGLAALGPAFAGGKDGGRSAAAARVAADKLPAKGSSISTATMEKLLENLININQQILDNSNELIKYAKSTKNALEEANDLARQKMLSDIENSRESKNPRPQNNNGGPAPDNKGGKGLFSTILGGILGTISTVIGGLVTTFTTILGLLGPIISFSGELLKLFTSIVSLTEKLGMGIIKEAVKLLPMLGDFFKWVGRFFITAGEFLIANPIVAAIVLAIAAIASLKAEDWSKFFDNFTKIFSDLAEGKFLDAIIRTMTALPGLIITALGRLLANILSFFGFKDTAKAIDDFLDKFDFPQLVVDAVHGIIDYIADFFSGLPELIGKAIDSMGELLSDIGKWILESGEYVSNFFGSVKDWVVQKFTDATKAFSDWWADFHPLDAILSFFSSVKEWVVNKFTEATDAFSKWWDSFSIIDIVLTPFNYIKDKATSLFNDLLKNVTDILSFDLVGKISNSISSLINSIWGFFKNLPSKAMDLVGSFVPDSLKNLWNSFFGTSNPNLANQNNVTPTLAGRSMAFVEQSARSATEQSSPVVIINNNNVNATGGGSAQNSIPRSSGAVSTAPQSSHIDRALYGNQYGTGVP